MANLVLPVPHQAQFFLRAPLRGEEALRAARAPGKLARSWWSGPAACTPTGWRWLWRAGKSCVHGAPRSGCRRLEAERLGRFDRWGVGVLDLDSQRCWRPCGRASSSLVTARCRRCSVTAGSSSSAAVVEAAARSRRSSAPEQTRDGRPSKGELHVLHHSARHLGARGRDSAEAVGLSEFEDHDWNTTKRYYYSGTNWPNLKVGRH